MKGLSYLIVRRRKGPPVGCLESRLLKMSQSLELESGGNLFMTDSWPYSTKSVALSGAEKSYGVYPRFGSWRLRD